MCSYYISLFIRINKVKHKNIKFSLLVKLFYKLPKNFVTQNVTWSCIALNGPDRGKEYCALTCGNDHMVKMWQLTLWKRSASSHQCAVELIRSLKGHSSTVTSVCFSDGGTLFASTSMDKTTRLWQVIKQE